MRVFARNGFHRSRVGEIAEEAGVAHGLLYHYFRSKDDVLETIFRETWSGLVAETLRIEASSEALRWQLHRFAQAYLGSWLVTPEVIRVLVREVARSPEVGNRVDEIRELFVILQRMIESARVRGEVRQECDAQFAAWSIYGAFEEVLTGWVLGQLPAEADDVERAIATVVDVTYAGVAA